MDEELSLLGGDQAQETEDTAGHCLWLAVGQARDSEREVDIKSTKLAANQLFSRQLNCGKRRKVCVCMCVCLGECARWGRSGVEICEN